ncbi:MAG TPA: glycosyltransferase family 2 protein [Gaiellaceae bacterium]|nr:glycosyltransferase family 2 protein [Gaiellaceae bacterium]
MAVAPTYSILLPFYNHREWLGDAIESVLAQTCKSWELIAIDDGSEDGSSEVATGFAAAEPRIRVLRRPNGGAAPARNTGLTVARGPYCALLDADDVWLPRKLERQLPLLRKDTVVFSDAYVEEDGRRYHYGRRVDLPEGVYPRGAVFAELLHHNFIPSHLTAVVPTDLLRSVGGWDDTLPPPRSSDWDLWLRLALAGVLFDYVAEPLAVYHVRPGSLSQDGEGMRRCAIAILRNLRDRAAGPQRAAVERRLRIANRELEVFLRKRAWLSASAGDVAAARRELVASRRANPRSARAVAGLVLALVPPFLRSYARRKLPISFEGAFVRH